MNDIPSLPEISSMLTGLWYAWFAVAVLVGLACLALFDFRERLIACAFLLVTGVAVGLPLSLQLKALDEHKATYRWKLECTYGSDCSAEERLQAQQCASHARERYGRYGAVRKRNHEAAMTFVQDCLSDQRLALVRCHLDELDCTINSRIASFETPWMLLAEAHPPTTLISKRVHSSH